MKLKDIKDKLDLSKNEYINKRVFRIGLGVIVLLGIIVLCVEGKGALFGSSGFCCPETEDFMACHNPFFQSCDDPMCDDKIILSGDCVGSPPGFLSQWFGFMVLFIISVSALVNHILNGKKVKR